MDDSAIVVNHLVYEIIFVVLVSPIPYRLAKRGVVTLNNFYEPQAARYTSDNQE